METNKFFLHSLLNGNKDLFYKGVVSFYIENAVSHEPL
jgi:hypothetical protein